MIGTENLGIDLDGIDEEARGSWKFDSDDVYTIPNKPKSAFFVVANDD